MFELKQRVISSLVGLGLLALVLVFYETVIFNIVIILLVLMAVYELLLAGRVQDCKPLFALCLVFSGFVPILQTQHLQSQLAVICGAYVFFLFIILIRYHSVLRYEKVAFGFMASLMIPFSFTSALFIHSRYERVLSILYLLIALGGAWFTDSGAYFAGRAFGKHKMAPTISPKKTIEGAVGGILTNIICYVLIAWAYTAVSAGSYGIGIQVNWPALILLAPLASVAGILGDLAASVIKRQCGIKDFGSIMPGHGGVMDRFDSVLFVMPMVFIYIQHVEIFTII